MNTKRILFWLCFIIILVLIVWGLIVAMNKSLPDNIYQPRLGNPPPLNASDHIRGSESAPITIIEYSDFQCPACEAYYPLVEKLMSESTSTIRFVYRHFPLIKHQNANTSATASEAAGKQGKFWEMYRLLFDNQKIWENSPDARAIFEDYAKQLGLNIDQFKKDYDSADIVNKIKIDLDGGISIGVNGTPTFFINGKGINNPRSYDEFKTIVKKIATSGAK